MNCLLFTEKNESIESEVLAFLSKHQIQFETTTDHLDAIHKIHEMPFDVVVMNAKTRGYRIDQAIQLIRDSNPDVKIIVRANKNSRALEERVRRARVFYYHLNSFGNHDFTTALQSAFRVH